jgi:hypothetical protein
MSSAGRFGFWLFNRRLWAAAVSGPVLAPVLVVHSLWFLLSLFLAL